MKLRLAAALPLAAALACASPADAATTLNLTGSSALSGPAGNTRTYTVGGITVQASAWTLLNGTTLTSAYLGAYSNGLGITNSNEGTGGSNMHAVDNAGSYDFIVLVFNQAVNIASGVLNPYGQNGGAADNDAAVSYANIAGLTPASTITAANPLFAGLEGNLWNVNGNLGAGYSTSFNSTGRFGNVWLIGASRTNADGVLDGFKLKSIVVTAVPEPGTWAMMLLGFGAVGFAMRRRREGLIPQAA